jgi:Neprosin activation peptide
MAIPAMVSKIISVKCANASLVPRPKIASFRMSGALSHESGSITYVALLSPATHTALDALVNTHAPEEAADADQLLLFPVRSELAAVKDGAGAVSVETVLDEIAKLKQLRALDLPEGLFRDVPARLVTAYRQRAASDTPRELRRHPRRLIGPSELLPRRDAMSQFISFDEFIRRTTRASARQPSDSSGVASTTEFARMRDHILDLYKGLKVTHSYVNSDGQYIDCVPIDQQPSLRRPDGTFEKVASPPTPIPLPLGAPAPIPPSAPTTDVFGNLQQCPVGTIPMRRITLEEMTRFHTLEDFFRKQPFKAGSTAADTEAVHQYAYTAQRRIGSIPCFLGHKDRPPC